MQSSSIIVALFALCFIAFTSAQFQAQVYYVSASCTGTPFQAVVTSVAASACSAKNCTSGPNGYSTINCYSTAPTQTFFVNYVLLNQYSANTCAVTGYVSTLVYPANQCLATTSSALGAYHYASCYGERSNCSSSTCGTCNGTANFTTSPANSCFAYNGLFASTSCANVTSTTTTTSTSSTSTTGNRGNATTSGLTSTTSGSSTTSAALSEVPSAFYLFVSFFVVVLSFVSL
jgi:hypothetical protein